MAENMPNIINYFVTVLSKNVTVLIHIFSNINISTVILLSCVFVIANIVNFKKNKSFHAKHPKLLDI